MIALIADGFHKNVQINLPTLTTYLHVPRPAVLTLCTCDNDSVESTNPDGVETYIACVTSPDGQFAIYNKSGKWEDLLNDTHYFTVQNKQVPDIINRKETLIVSCHDPKAWGKPKGEGE